MKTHLLSTEKFYFQSVWDGLKTAELRKNDRNFKVGDSLVLREVVPCGYEMDFFSGRQIWAVITHIVNDERFLKHGFVLLSMKLVDRIQSHPEANNYGQEA